MNLFFESFLTKTDEMIARFIFYVILVSVEENSVNEIPCNFILIFLAHFRTSARACNYYRYFLVIFNHETL